MTTQPVQVDFPAGVTISSLPDPMPFDGGLAIDSRGGLWGWGVNTANELCLAGPSVVLRPTQLPVHGVTLATGAARHIVFDAGGTLYAWGRAKPGSSETARSARRPHPSPWSGCPAGGRQGPDLVVDGLGRPHERRLVLRLGLQRRRAAGRRIDDEQRSARPRSPARRPSPRSPWAAAPPPTDRRWCC